MLFAQDRNQMRRFYCQAWKKHRNNEPLQPLEQQISTVISLHPEYHALLENEEAALEKDFFPELGESNPFLHLSMHLAIRDQLNSDLPAGITEIYQALLNKHNDLHDVEHRMMECLINALWKVQKEGAPFNDSAYLRCLKSI